MKLWKLLNCKSNVILHHPDVLPIKTIAESDPARLLLQNWIAVAKATPTTSNGVRMFTLTADTAGDLGWMCSSLEGDVTQLHILLLSTVRNLSVQKKRLLNSSLSRFFSSSKK